MELAPADDMDMAAASPRVAPHAAPPIAQAAPPVAEPAPPELMRHQSAASLGSAATRATARTWQSFAITPGGASNNPEATAPDATAPDAPAPDALAPDAASLHDADSLRDAASLHDEGDIGRPRGGAPAVGAMEGVWMAHDAAARAYVYARQARRQRRRGVLLDAAVSVANSAVSLFGGFQLVACAGDWGWGPLLLISLAVAFVACSLAKDFIVWRAAERDADAARALNERFSRDLLAILRTHAGDRAFSYDLFAAAKAVVDRAAPPPAERDWAEAMRELGALPPAWRGVGGPDAGQQG
jgi:hypothetical protein